MRLGLLSKRALYRELRSSIGYYDARRIIRCIESNELTDVDAIEWVLNQAELDPRHVALTLEIIRRNPFSLVDERDKD